MHILVTFYAYYPKGHTYTHLFVELLPYVLLDTGHFGTHSFDKSSA